MLTDGQTAGPKALNFFEETHKARKPGFAWSSSL